MNTVDNAALARFHEKIAHIIKTTPGNMAVVKDENEFFNTDIWDTSQVSDELRELVTEELIETLDEIIDLCHYNIWEADALTFIQWLDEIYKTNKDNE